jgi:hypothetical protein
VSADLCRAWRERLAASLVGALGAEEEAALRAHLDGCWACRAEAAELGAVVALLPLADVSRIAELPVPPAGLGDRIVSRVAGERSRSDRRRRRWFGAAVAGIAAATTLVALTFTLVTQGGEAAVITLKGPPGVTASATVRAKAWGTQIELDVTGLPAEQTYGVWLEEPDGRRTPAGTFVSVGGRRMHMVLAAGLDLPAASGLGVSTAAGETILYSELAAIG